MCRVGEYRWERVESIEPHGVANTSMVSEDKGGEEGRDDGEEGGEVDRTGGDARVFGVVGVV